MPSTGSNKKGGGGGTDEGDVSKVNFILRSLLRPARLSRNKKGSSNKGFQCQEILLYYTETTTVNNDC